jgi:hypothetical protein
LEKIDPREKGSLINDKYYLFYTYDLYPDVYVRLIDIKSYRIKELGVGMKPLFSPKSNSVLILKDAHSNSENKTNCTLYSINLESFETETLFIDDSDSTRLCYIIADYGECTQLETEIINDIEIYQFDLFIDKSAIYKDYYIERIRMRIDEKGKLLSRELID